MSENDNNESLFTETSVELKSERGDVINLDVKAQFVDKEMVHTTSLRSIVTALCLGFEEYLTKTIQSLSDIKQAREGSKVNTELVELFGASVHVNVVKSYELLGRATLEEVLETVRHQCLVTAVILGAEAIKSQSELLFKEDIFDEFLCTVLSISDFKSGVDGDFAELRNDQLRDLVAVLKKYLSAPVEPAPSDPPGETGNSVDPNEPGAPITDHQLHQFH